MRRLQVAERILVIACGALAHEINDLKQSHGWQHLQVRCIDPLLHNRPERIAERVRQKIHQYRDDFDRIFIGYADCGSRGAIDQVIAEEGGNIERLPGAHCYQFFAGADRFIAMADAEPGTFYLTDFLARHFDRFVIEPLQLDTHPELRDAYFGNYRRLLFLSQTHDQELLQSARRAANRLGLDFEHVHCGYGELESGLKEVVMRANVG